MADKQNIKGCIRHFTDRLEVESPGRLPELVRVQNIRRHRYSRNPSIARVLAELTDYVREMNEGVERMYREMQQVGLREPEYEVTPGGVRVTLYKQVEATIDAHTEELPVRLQYLSYLIGEDKLAQLIEFFRREKQLPTRAVSQLLGVTTPTARRYLTLLAQEGLVTEKQKAKFDPTATWVITDAVFWTRLGS